MDPQAPPFAKEKPPAAKGSESAKVPKREANSRRKPTPPSLKRRPEPAAASTAPLGEPKMQTGKVFTQDDLMNLIMSMPPAETKPKETGKIFSQDDLKNIMANLSAPPTQRAQKS